MNLIVSMEKNKLNHNLLGFFSRLEKGAFNYVNTWHFKLLHESKCPQIDDPLIIMPMLENDDKEQENYSKCPKCHLSKQ